MRKLLLLLFVTLLIAGCGTIGNSNISEEMDYSFLALGDSYTIGEGVEVEESWPFQLTHRLRERGYKVAPPRIIARTGWTSRDLIRNIDEELDVHRDFNLVSILIGVNNQYQGKPRTEFEEDLREIFRKAISHSKTRERGVFALSIPDYSVTPFGEDNAEVITAEIDRFNDTVRRIAEEFEVDFYNITPSSREALTSRELIAADSLHPSALMYRFWVDDIVEEVIEKLPTQSLKAATN